MPIRNKPARRRSKLAGRNALTPSKPSPTPATYFHLLDLPIDIIENIVGKLEKRMLGVAYRRLYESFPVLDPEARVMRPLFDLAYRIEHYAKFIPSRNAAFIRHLVWVLKPDGRTYSCFEDFLVKCVNVDELTLYVLAKRDPGAYDLQLACKKFPLYVRNLSLRIVKPEYDFERSEWPGELLRWLPNILHRFTRVEHLGIFFEPGFDVPSPVVLPLIAEGTTSHLKIKSFETTILPSGMDDYGLHREIFPFLESITFGKERIQNYLHEKGKKYDCIPSPFRGNRLTPSTLSEIMSIESQCDLKANVKTTHMFIRPDDQHAELSQSWETLVSPDILSWAKFHDILIIPECRTGDLSCFRTSSSQIFLDLTDVEYNPRAEQIESFLTEIGPSTQSLIFNTYRPMPTNEEYSRDDILIQYESERRTRIIRNFLTVVVNRIPEFRLEDIQNFPRLDNDDCDPFDDMVKLSAECFEPLSRLPSLTSIDLDFSTLVFANPGNGYRWTNNRFGGFVGQVRWLVNCTSLKYLALRNFCSSTAADEAFVFKLPQKIPSMTWVWTGEVELQRATCTRLSYRLPPISKNAHDGCFYRRDTDLPHNVLYDWRKLIIVAAGSPTDLNLKFDQLRAYVIDQWGGGQ